MIHDDNVHFGFDLFFVQGLFTNKQSTDSEHNKLDYYVSKYLNV